LLNKSKEKNSILFTPLHINALFPDLVEEDGYHSADGFGGLGLVGGCDDGGDPPLICLKRPSWPVVVPVNDPVLWLNRRLSKRWWYGGCSS
jgi:hypothetical protein